MGAIPRKMLHRRTIPAPPAIQEYISKVLSVSDSDLPGLLDSFSLWIYPKGDLFQWVDVLDKCDKILETLCKKYELQTVQKTPFQDLDRSLLVSILRFSAFLLDHCANRSLYNSSNNINELLVTTDIDVLEQACRMVLRTAQRASYQRNGKGHFPLSQDRLWKLAASAQYTNPEYSTSPILMEQVVGKNAMILSDWATLRYTFYKPELHLAPQNALPPTSPVGKQLSPHKTPVGRKGKSAIEALSPAGSLRGTDQGNETLGVIEISASTHSRASLDQVFDDAVRGSQLPVENHLEFMLRLRFAQNVSKPYALQQLITIRLLCLASLAYTVPETVLQAKLLSMEPNIIDQLSKVVHADSDTSDSIRASGFAALEAIAHHRSRLSDVLTVLGASISHGLLMSSFRNLLAEFESNERSTAISADLVDAHINLLHYLSTTNTAGSMLCAAGLVQTLASFLGNRQEGALRILVKSLNLLDHLVYGFPQAFQIFCDCGGLRSLVRRIETEVSFDVASASNFMTAKTNAKVDYAMTHERFSLLKTMLKFVVHMMQTRGTADGLRNLVETQLPATMKVVYENLEIFGSSIFASTTNIMATFIHNEPSAYQVLHEIALPELFLKAVMSRVLPSSDALTAIPNAFGAICLNTQGLQLFKDLSPMTKFMQIFVSQQHCETMKESDIASVLGASMDELIRHHPSLKRAVLAEIPIVMRQICDLGQNTKDLTLKACRLASAPGSDACQSEIQRTTYLDEDGIERSNVRMFIDAISRFLDGFMQNANHARAFVAEGYVTQLLEFYDLPCLSYDFAKSAAALSLSHVLQITCEYDSVLLLEGVFSLIQKSIADLRDKQFMTCSDSRSYCDKLLNGMSTVDESTVIILALERIHTLSTLLSDLYAASPSRTRNILPFYQFLTVGPHHYTHMLTDLGELHRSLIWDDIRFTESLSPAWVKATQHAGEQRSSSEAIDVSGDLVLPDVDVESARFRDAKMLRFFLGEIPVSLVRFFQGISKFIIRRNGIASSQKMAGIQVGNSVAHILVAHLSWSYPPDTDDASRRRYQFKVLNMIQMLLCDERGGSNLITSVFMHFQKGLEYLLSLSSALWEDVKKLPTVDVDETVDDHTRRMQSERVQILGAFKIVFHLLQQFTSSKIVLQSPQTVTLDNKHKGTDLPYFHPEEFLERIRVQVLPLSWRIWQDDEFNNIPTPALKLLIKVLWQCIESIGTVPEDSRASSALQQMQAENISRSEEIESLGASLSEKRGGTLSTNDRDFPKPDHSAATDDQDSAAAFLMFRDHIMQHSVQRSIEVLRTHSDVVFDLADLVLHSVRYTSQSSWIDNSISTLVQTFQDLLSRTVGDLDLHFAATTHFLAKLVHDDMFYAHCKAALIASIPAIIAIIKTCVAQDRVNLCKGASNLIVFYDNLLARQDDASILQLPPDAHAGPQVLLLSDTHTKDICQSTVALIEKHLDHDGLVSILRFLVRVSRSPSYCDDFNTKGLLQHIFRQLHKQAARCDDNVKTTLLLLLRHLVETPQFVRSLMENEIENWFRSKTRSVDLSTFVKQNNALAFRSPELFVDCSLKLCSLPRFDQTSILQVVALKDKTEGLIGHTGDDTAMLTDNVPKIENPQSIDPILEPQSGDGVMSFLLDELYLLKDAADTAVPLADSPSSEDILMTDASDTKIESSKDEPLPVYLYRALLLQCICELLTSYGKCKQDFITYTREAQISNTLPKGKLRSDALQLIISELLHQPTTATADGLDTRKQYFRRHLLREALIALCADIGFDDGIDIAQIRRVTLDSLQRVLKEAMVSNVAYTLRCGRVLALADLIHSLLTPDTSSKNQAHSIEAHTAQIEIAKLMLERQFVALLTQALSEVDLLYPDSRRIIKAILRPLRSLTKMSIRHAEDMTLLTLESGDVEDVNDQLQFQESESDVGNDVDQQREETPDLYRNSALGIFGTEMHESESDDYSSDEDEEMYTAHTDIFPYANGDRIYDERMDFEEDGSETGSAVSDEDLELDDEEAQQHDMELILEEEEDDSDDTMSHDSTDDESSFSGELELIEENGDESEWNADEESPHTDSDSSQPRAIMQGLRDTLIDSAGSGAVGSFPADNLAQEGTDPEDDGSIDDEDLLLSQEDDLDEENDTLEGEDSWEWSDPTGDPFSDLPRNTRDSSGGLWATVGPDGELTTQGFDPQIQIIRRPRLSGVVETTPPGNRSSILGNPILSRPDSPRTLGRQAATQGNNFSDWIESIEALLGGGAVRFIGDIMRTQSGIQGRARNALPSIRVEVSGNQRNLVPAQMEHLLNRVATSDIRNPGGRPEDPVAAAAFEIASTLRRYQDEILILYPGNTSERNANLVRHLLKAMSPEEVEAAPALDKPDEPSTAAQGAHNTDSTTNIVEEEQASVPEIVSQVRQGMPEDEPEATSVSTESRIALPEVQDRAANAAVPTRQRIYLRGQPVDIDITGLGIDLEFLEALPEEMREEVITQHIRERQASARVTRETTTELAPEFLEALPAEIRTELMQQEAADRRRHERLTRRPQTQPTSVGSPSDIDPASFLASLDPALRHSILADQDESFLQQLPPDMIAEIVQGRAHSRHQNLDTIAVGATSSGRLAIAEGAGPNQPKPKRKQDVIQLLDKAGIASLLRLLFLPAPPRNILHDVLLNLCENKGNRAEIVGQILNILQDGSTDLQAVERCFASLTRRSKSLGETSSRMSRGRLSLTSSIGSISPTLIVLQSLQILTYLLSWNDQLPSYFLTEHDLSSLRKPGRGKERAKETSKAGKYPINSMLNLLDRPSILNDQNLLEPLSHVLSAISRPLLLLLKVNRPAAGELQGPDISISGAPESSVPVLSEGQVTQAANTTEPKNPVKSRNLIPPNIPRSNLKLIVNVVTANACSGKTFQQTLAAIHHFTALVGAQQTISDELLSQAQSLTAKIYSQLSSLKISIERVESGTEIRGSVLADFSSQNSCQAKFLRILKTIDYLFDSGRGKNLVQDSENSNVSSVDRKLTLFNSIQAQPIWAHLSDCLTLIYHKPDTIHIATVLLPLIEALMVICRTASLAEGKRVDGHSPSSSSSLWLQHFFAFTEEHKKILNQMVRNNPGLMSGTFALLTENPKVLEFDNKRNYFGRKLRDRGQNKDHYQTIQLHVRRDAVFLDSYKELHFKTGNEIKYSKLNIRFTGEEGIDAGGVSREWFQVLARQMFDPNYALFVPVNANRNTYHPNKTSGINPEHLLFFKFVGRIVGKALYDGRLLDCHFSRPIYRKILGKNVSLKDMETLDLAYYKSLVWMLENDISDVIVETFSVERDDFGVVNIIDLIPDGRTIAVTEKNKQEYVTRITEYRLLESVSEQLENFMIGFNEVIPPELVSIFNEQELELLISGLPDIDVDDWKNNTEYHNYSTASPQIQWFWRAVRTFDDEEKARLLQFSTGSSRIPIGGFVHLEGMHGTQKFNIHRDYSIGSRLPQSHTCFNQLDLPEYESYEALRTSLLIAISEGSEGFGFA